MHKMRIQFPRKLSILNRTTSHSFFGLSQFSGTFHVFNVYDISLQNGQTALSIAQRLGYISVVETLKVVTEKEVTTTTTTTVEEKYRVIAPESMQETFMSDSEDEGGRRRF